MIDSDNTSALDNYGVWVKKSSKDLSQDEIKQEDSFDIASDLPDFSSMENTENKEDDFDSGETSLTSEELLNITGDMENTAIEGAEEAGLSVENEDITGLEDSAAIDSTNPETTADESIFGTEEPVAETDDTSFIDVPEIENSTESAQDIPSPIADEDDRISDILKQNTQTDPEEPMIMSFDDSDDSTESNEVLGEPFTEEQTITEAVEPALS